MGIIDLNVGNSCSSGCINMQYVAVEKQRVEQRQRRDAERRRWMDDEPLPAQHMPVPPAPQTQWPSVPAVSPADRPQNLMDARADQHLSSTNSQHMQPAQISNSSTVEQPR